MKTITHQFALIALALLVAFSPLQLSFASTSECMNMDHTVHNPVNSSSQTDHSIHLDALSNNTCPDENHCNNNGCGTDCYTSAALVAVPDTVNVSVDYAPKTYLNLSKTLLLSDFSASLFRPPRS